VRPVRERDAAEEVPQHPARRGLPPFFPHARSPYGQGHPRPAFSFILFGCIARTGLSLVLTLQSRLAGWAPPCPLPFSGLLDQCLPFFSCVPCIQKKRRRTIKSSKPCYFFLLKASPHIPPLTDLNLWRPWMPPRPCLDHSLIPHEHFPSPYSYAGDASDNAPVYYPDA
jgi:hypothetical protein